MMRIFKAVMFTTVGAVAMLVTVIVDDGTFEMASQLRRGPEGRTWLNPTAFLVRSRQVGDQKSLHAKCSNEAKKVARAIFVRGICQTQSSSRTCAMGLPRWTGKEIHAPLVSEVFWDYGPLSERFSMLGDEMLRFNLSEKGHFLNVAISMGAVDFDRKTVSFDSEKLARDYHAKLTGVCAALRLERPSRFILTNADE